MTEFSDEYWTSRDGLKLHFRDYAGASDRPPVLCLPGLTRNARDFENLAQHLAGKWRVICPDMRGRGDSAYSKDSATYNPLQYVEDVTLLLDEAGISRFVAVGTSLGGLMTLLLAATAPGRVAAAVLNDIGPEIEATGLDRIGSYVGQGRTCPTWMHAARALEESHGEFFPEFDVTDWLSLAKRTMTVGSNGRIVFDYDMKIAEPFKASGVAAPPDLWPTLGALEDKPVLLIRGALSDVLSAATLDRMHEALPQADVVTLPRVGHAPTLDEPECVAAIDRMLAKVA
ncbi:MAG: alpha/beta hydrolase [Novosphingobium sp.]|nr:alpha/beta hydrolase [Novosphingobium sp.]